MYEEDDVIENTGRRNKGRKGIKNVFIYIIVAVVVYLLIVIVMPRFLDLGATDPRAEFERYHRVLVSCVMMYSKENQGDFSQFTPWTLPTGDNEPDHSLKQFLSVQDWEMFLGSQSDPDKAYPKYAEYKVTDKGDVESIWKPNGTKNESKWVKLTYIPE